MPVTQRCNYAGTLGKPVPTRSFGATVAHTLASTLASALKAPLRGLAARPRRPD